MDRNGEKYKAIIQSETMLENANLVFTKDGKFETDNLRYAMNIPHKSNTHNDRNYYRHKPSADWVDEIL